jgi:hypothetical protein
MSLTPRATERVVVVAADAKAKFVGPAVVAGLLRPGVLLEEPELVHASTNECWAGSNELCSHSGWQ